MPLNPEEEQMVLEYLVTMKSLIYSEQCVKIVQEISGKDIVVFIGNTRAGKSTIVNYVIGNKLRAIKFTKKQIKIVKSSENDAGPVIGSEATSETTIPTAWNSTKINGLIVDAPGFDDNRGEAQDVANAFYIKELITNANSIKFVLITDVNDIINDNIGQFINFIDKIHTILPQCHSLLKGIIVVFNKDRDETTKPEMIQYLTKKIINQDKIKMKDRSLINFLIKNPSNFVICSTPDAEEDGCEEIIFHDVDDAIEKQAEVLPKHLLLGVTPGISDRSRCFLLEAHNYFTEFKELDDLLKKVENTFKKTVIPTKIYEEKDTNKMKEYKVAMAQAEEKLSALLSSRASIKDSLLAIGDYIPDVQELQEGSDIYMKLDFVRFVDEILHIEESNIFRVKVNTVIAGMKDKVTVCKINLQEKMFEISTEEANKKYQELADQQKQDQIEHLKKLNELQQKQIEMLASIKTQTRSVCVIQ